MAVGESAGTVFVTIDGDASPLLAKYAQAETQSRAAGQNVATGFNAAANASDATAASIDRLGVVLREEGAAASLAHQRNLALAGGFRQVGQSAKESVTEIQAVGGAVRVLSGEQGIRVVERFLTTLGGGGFAQAIYPLLGIAATAELGVRAFEHFAGKSDELKSSLEELKKATSEADSALSSLVRTGDELITHAAGREGGPASEAKARATQLKQERNDISDQILGLEHDIDSASIRFAAKHPMSAPLSSEDIKSWNPPEVVAEREALNKQIDALQDKQAAKQGQYLEAEKDAARSSAVEAGTLSAKRIEAEEQAAQRFVELSKLRYSGELEAQHAANQASIAAMTGEYERVVATGQEEIRFEKAKQDEIAGYALATRDRTIKEIAAKGNAESQGKTRPEQALIREGASADTDKAKDELQLSNAKGVLNVQAAQAKAALSVIELNRKIQEQLETAADKGLENITGSTHFQEESSRLITEELTKRERINEIQSKAAGETEALGIEGRKIALEGQYSTQLLHTSAQHIAYLQQVASLEEQANAAKIKGLQLELAEASAAGEIVKAAEIQAALDKAKAEAANQQTKAQGQVTTAQAQSSPQAQLRATLKQWGDVKEQMNQGALQVVSTFEKVPQTLAQSIIQAHGLGQAFAQMGKQLATSLLTDALKVGLHAVIAGLEKLIPMFGQLAGATAAAAGAQKAAAAVSVSTAAGEGFAWAFESVMAALPFPANIALAPEVAAATFASILAGGSLAAGSDSAPGGMTLVGERGPEIVNLPRGSQVIPNHKITAYANGTPGSSVVAGGGNISIQNLSVHAHGITNPSQFTEHVFRTIPKVAKNRTASQSPYSR